MNRPSLLHIIERLEGFLGRLPATIQKPVLQELTPLKELFLQQRPPRFVLTGSNRFSIQEVVATLFGWAPPEESRDVLLELFCWQAIDLGGHGTITLLDARGSDAVSDPRVQEELQKQPADMFLFLGDDAGTGHGSASELGNLSTFLGSNTTARTRAKVIGIVLQDTGRVAHPAHNGESAPHLNSRARLLSALQEKPQVNEHLLQVFELSFIPAGKMGGETKADTQGFMAALARELPNEARVEWRGSPRTASPRSKSRRC
jgi:hypothetical protein